MNTIFHKFLCRASHGTSLRLITANAIALHRQFGAIPNNTTTGIIMPASTPISPNKTAAMSRVIDSICKGYRLYCTGTVSVDKAEQLACKLHERHAIGATPAQRLMRKKRGKANGLLVMYWPLGAAQVEWLMLFTAGQLDSHEQLHDAANKHRLEWLGYELVRHPIRGVASWTWRRPKIEMAEHYAFLDALLAKRHHDAVEQHMSRVANQPGFHGIREQSWALGQYARQHGYQGNLPHLFYVQKISHGERLILGK